MEIVGGGILNDYVGEISVDNYTFNLLVSIKICKCPQISL
jgi:hypothetical protein